MLTHIMQTHVQYIHVGPVIINKEINVKYLYLTR